MLYKLVKWSETLHNGIPIQKDNKIMEQRRGHCWYLLRIKGLCPLETRNLWRWAIKKKPMLQLTLRTTTLIFLGLSSPANATEVGGPGFSLVQPGSASWELMANVHGSSRFLTPSKFPCETWLGAFSQASSTQEAVFRERFYNKILFQWFMGKAKSSSFVSSDKNH